MQIDLINEISQKEMTQLVKISTIIHETEKLFAH